MKYIQPLKKALEEAIQSTHKYKVGASIFSKKILISSGRNYSLKSRRSITNKFLKYKGSIHAEVDAIINAKRDLRGCSILVVRINKNEKLLSSFPCKFCLNYIKYVGIKEIFFFNTEGKLERKKI